MVTSFNSHNFLFFEKLIFPTVSKTAEFDKKTQGILGVKSIANHIINKFKYVSLHSNTRLASLG
jgi:hypothetical protein